MLAKVLKTQSFTSSNTGTSQFEAPIQRKAVGFGALRGMGRGEEEEGRGRGREGEEGMAKHSARVVPEKGAALFLDPEMSFSRPRDWSILFSAAACLFFTSSFFSAPQ